MRPMRSAAITLLVVTLLSAGLTGCLGGDDTPDRTLENSSTTSPGASGGSLGDATETLEPRLATYEGLDETVVNTIQTTGEFEPQDQCILGGCLTGTFLQRIDLPAPGPRGLPLHVVIEMTTEGGSPVVFLDVGDGTIYSMERTGFDEDPQHIEAVILPGSDPVQAVVAWFGFPPDTGARYDLEAMMMAHHDIAFSGVAVAMPLGPHDLVTVEDARGNQPVDVVIFGPDDVMFDRETSSGTLEYTLPADAPSGDYILLSPPGGPDIRITTNGTSAAMTPVKYAIEMGQPHQTNGAEPVEWTFDTAGTPLNVGFYVEREGVVFFNVGAWSAQVDSPAGTVLTAETECFVVFCGGGDGMQLYRAQPADPKLVAGTYSVTFEQEPGTSTSVGHFIVSFAR